MKNHFLYFAVIAFLMLSSYYEGMAQDEKVARLDLARKDSIVHTVRSGETMSSIAGKYGVTVSDLQTWNTNSNRKIHVGQRLIVFVPMEHNTMVQSEKLVEVAPVEKDRIVHTVRSGETLSSIAREYGVTASDLQTWNNNGNRKINVGQRLIVFVPMEHNTMEQSEKLAEVATVEKDRIIHTVRSGETLSSIARKHDVTVHDLQAWNNNANVRIHVGQRLIVMYANRQ